jgi:hypothetical protein
MCICTIILLGAWVWVRLTVLYYHIVPTLPPFVSYSNVCYSITSFYHPIMLGFRFAVDIDTSVTNAPARHVKLPAPNQLPAIHTVA